MESTDVIPPWLSYRWSRVEPDCAATAARPERQAYTFARSIIPGRKLVAAIKHAAKVVLGEDIATRGVPLADLPAVAG
ncbi:MAG: hypothetical protein M3R31_05395 [Pseudomonadota bacterium]|nr:hypothetical protein [Pseudomonadota bacterium]